MLNSWAIEEREGMKAESITSEAKAFVHNATIFLGVILAGVVLYVAIVFLINHLTGIGGAFVFAANSIWAFLKSIPAWLWIVLAILRVGGKIERGLANLSARLPERRDQDS